MVVTPASSIRIPELEQRREQAVQRLQSYGQDHVLAAWDALSAEERRHLLEQIEAVPWSEIQGLYQNLVVEKRVFIPLPAEWEPAQPLTGNRSIVKDAGLRVL